MDAALSKEWRINRSSIKMLEYAEVLRSLRRVVMHHSKDIKSISYTTEAESDMIAGHYDGVIVINPAPLEASTYPLPEATFDVLCGLAIHEVGHQLVKSDDVSQYLERKLHGVQMDMIFPIRTLGEDIVVDDHFKGKQKQYINRARKHFETQVPTPGTSSVALTNPVIDACNAFSAIMLYNAPPAPLAKDAQDILMVLFKGYQGITARNPESRAIAYVDIFKAIVGLLDNTATKMRLADPKGKRLRANYTKDAYNDQAKNKLLNEASRELTKTMKGQGKLTQQESIELNDIIEQEIMDVTETVNQLAESIEGESGPYRRSRESIILTQAPNYAGHVAPDQDLLRELAWLERVKIDKETRIEKPTLSGHINKRGLYRAGLDGAIFRQKVIKSVQPKRIWLLMDNSGSMGGSKMYTSCAAVHKVIPLARIYEYDSSSRNCTRIDRVDEQAGMKSIQNGGGTPSGDAIVYVSHLLQKQGGGLLIHFTDGEVTTGIQMDEAYQILEKKAPAVTLLNAVESGGIITSTNYHRVSNKMIESPADFSQLLKQAIQKLWGLG